MRKNVRILIYAVVIVFPLSFISLQIIDYAKKPKKWENFRDGVILNKNIIIISEGGFREHGLGIINQNKLCFMGSWHQTIYHDPQGEVISVNEKYVSRIANIFNREINK
jgi:hypothetical protein